MPDPDLDDLWNDAFDTGTGERAAPLERLKEDPVDSETPDLEAVMNIPVTVSMEIGRAKITIRNLLQLNQGSVVELDRLAGEPLDVLANGTLIAHGEVVVVNDKFGIRLTDVISAQERVKKLR
ncbi:MAG: flagellar motor switch protein FliN [Pseudomonadota bacterium]